MENWKEIVGALLGATIAIAWIAYALLGAGNMLFLVVAIAISMFFGTLSGGFFAISNSEVGYREVLGWLCGVSIGIAWIVWALLFPGDMLGLVVAISISIVFGILSGGLIGMSTKSKNKEI